MRGGGVDGSQRLTAAIGALLVVLLAALGFSILSIRPLIWWHFLFGMALIPPVLLKLATTGRRFIHHYRRTPEYVRRGPPRLPLRLMAPLLVATLFVFATGVALLAVGPSGGLLVGLHKASFIVWFVVSAVHVLAHVRPLPHLVAADWVPSERRMPGSAWRRWLLAGTLVAGAVLAAATVHFAAAWVQWFDQNPSSESSSRLMHESRSAPNGIRTRATALKGPRPGPLVDGGEAKPD